MLKKMRSRNTLALRILRNKLTSEYQQNSREIRKLKYLNEVVGVQAVELTKSFIKIRLVCQEICSQTSIRIQQLIPSKRLVILLPVDQALNMQSNRKRSTNLNKLFMLLIKQMSLLRMPIKIESQSIKVRQNPRFIKN